MGQVVIPTRDRSGRFTRREAIRFATLAGMGAIEASKLAASGQASTAPFMAQTAARQGRRLVVADTMTLLSADPARAYEIFQYLIFRPCYDSLVTVPPNDISRMVPMLSTGWMISPDATTLTFKLRPNVKFVTGNTLTSADVRWSLLRVKNVNASPAWFLDPIKTIDTPDPLTVTIRLKDPDVSYLAVLISTNLSILDSTFLRTKGGTTIGGDKAEEWLNSNTAGMGPYVMTEWIRDSQVTLKRFPGSWRPGWFDEVIMKAVPEPATGKLLLERGDADVVMNLVPEQFAELKDNKNVKIAETLFAGFPYVGLTRVPQVHEALVKPQVGYAIRYAIDYAGIRSLVPGAVTPPSIVPIGHFGALDPQKDGIKTDVRRAKELLTAAGYPNGFEAVLSHSTSPLPGTVTGSVLAAKVQADLAQIGIRVKLEPLEPKVFSQRYRSQKAQMVIAEYVGDYPDASNWLELYIPGGVLAKRLGWTDPNNKTIQLTAQSIKTVNPNQRKQLYQEVQRELMKDSPWIPLLQGVQRIAYRADLKGVVSNAMWWTDVALMSRA
jgi:peptide/nickel transport system substrate-binding protein